MLEKAAQGKVDGLTWGSEAFESVKAAVENGEYDEIIVSTSRAVLPLAAGGDLPRRSATVKEWASMNQRWQ